MANIGLYSQILNAGNDPTLKHLGLVKRVAAHLSVRIPAVMEMDELVQVGMIGLLEAMESFDANRGIDFAVFATKRIRGAMLDEVRRLANQPRSVTSILQHHTESEELLSAELGRQPNHDEMAQRMSLTSSEFQRQRTQAERYQVVSVELVEAEVLDLAGHESLQPEKQFSDKQALARLIVAIDSLPERDQLVMSLYYRDELNLKEIGAVLGVTESRVSQMLSSSVKKLRLLMES